MSMRKNTNQKKYKKRVRSEVTIKSRETKRREKREEERRIIARFERSMRENEYYYRGLKSILDLTKRRKKNEKKTLDSSV